jgi:hypothetical protein
MILFGLSAPGAQRLNGNRRQGLQQFSRSYYDEGGEFNLVWFDYLQ